jgi:integrase
VVNRYLIDLEAFNQYMQLQNLAQGTIENYLYELAKIPKEDEKQMSYLIENRQKRMLMSAYRKYLYFLKSVGKINAETLFSKLDTYKLPKRRGKSDKGNWFKQSEWGDIIANGANRCARMFLYLGFHFGLRLGEIINLRVKDIDLQKKRVFIRQRVKSVGKNQEYWHPKHFRDRVLPMTKNQKNILTRWINERPDLNHPYLLWSGRTKKKVSGRSAQRWTQLAKEGLKPHDLRRSFAKVLYYNSEKDLKLVQATLGHASISTTSAYLGLEAEEIQEKYERAMT